MRKAVENISLLQKQINDLQLEKILDRSHEIARISEPESAEEHDPDQGHGLSIRDRSDHG